MRTLIDYCPFSTPEGEFWSHGFWPAEWIAHPDTNYKAPAVYAYRNKFALDCDRTIRLHVTADERYDLFLDGERVGRGSERGDTANWFFETYDFELNAGEHILVARVWSMRECAPYAQMSSRPGFFLLAEGEPETFLNTGRSPWTVKPLTGYAMVPSPMTFWAGSKWEIDGATFAWGFERGKDDGWIEPLKLTRGRTASIANEDPATWLLRPSGLPEMFTHTVPPGKVRHAEHLDGDDPQKLRVSSPNHDSGMADRWQALIDGVATVTVPAATRLRAIVDLQNYYCSYPELTVTGGRGATVRLHFAESLYENIENQYKGNRNETENKLFVGTGDLYKIGDGTHAYEPLWWEAGRYLEILVETASEPVTIEAIELTETHYPHHVTAQFEASDPRLADVIPIAVRALEMCSHETYFDCPYY